MTKQTVNIFEQASRQKLRFDTAIGMLSVEELWALPLTTTNGKVNLDQIAVALNKELKGSEESFVSNSKRNELLQLRFDVVKHIIETLVQEKEAKTAEVQRAANIQKMDELIAAREQQELANLPLDQLREMRAKL